MRNRGRYLALFLLKTESFQLDYWGSAVDKKNMVHDFRILAPCA